MLPSPLRRLLPSLPLALPLVMPLVMPLALSLGGCAGWFSHVLAPDGGEVQIEGLGPHPAVLDGLLPYGAYGVLPADSSMYVSDVPLEEILAGNVRNGQFLHAQLLWTPKPGETPVEPTAMNVTLRYVVVADGKMGIYGGGGFAWPRGTLGEDSMSLVIKGSSLSLLARTEGFVDLLTPAELTGTIYVPFDPEATRKYRRGVSQMATDAFGATRWVDHRDETIPLAQVLALVSPEAEGQIGANPAADTAADTASRIDSATASRSGS